MSENLRAYVTALFGFDAVVRRTSPDQWSYPTPCEGWDALLLLNHNIFVTNMVVELSRGVDAAVPATRNERERSAPHGKGYVLHRALFRRDLVVSSGDDAHRMWDKQREAVLDALDQPGALRARARSPWGHRTVDEFLGFAFLDPLIHTWDLAKAVGHPVYVDEHLVDIALECVANPGDGRELYQSGMFSPRVQARGADPLTRLIAASGRDPAWSHS